MQCLVPSKNCSERETNQCKRIKVKKKNNNTQLDTSMFTLYSGEIVVVAPISDYSLIAQGTCWLVFGGVPKVILFNIRGKS